MTVMGYLTDDSAIFMRFQIECLYRQAKQTLRSPRHFLAGLAISPVKPLDLGLFKRKALFYYLHDRLFPRNF